MLNLFSKLRYFRRSSRTSVAEKIDQLQRKLMGELVQSAGQDYQNQIHRMLESINEQHQDPSSPTGFRSHHNDLTFPLTTEQDFWRYRQIEALDMSVYAGELVERASESGHLKPYILKNQHLSDRLSEALGKNLDRNSLSSVIEAIPILHRAEPKFHAAASVNYDPLGSPYICHYYATMRSMQILAQILVRNTMIFVPNRNGVMLSSPKPEYFYDRLSPETPVLTSICAILHSLEQRTWALPTGGLPAYSLAATAEEWPVKEIGAAVSLGAKMMLWLHEIGHHILGHFESKSARLEKESEADRFAVSCLLAAEGDTASHHLIGAEIPFLLLPILPPSPDYPPPADRASLVKRTREQAFPAFAPVLQYPLIPLYIALSIWGIYPSPSKLKAEVVYPLISQLNEMKAFAENVSEEV